MRAFAPGKLVLTGAYAVLEGAPAISVAVTRGAFADTSRTALSPTPEVAAALPEGSPAPHADASSMFIGARKLGLGASSAILVATLGALEADAGADLEDPTVRARLFERARDAHALAQSGGSGVDVATSVHGGVIQYTMGQAPRAVRLPEGLRVDVLACGTSARTSELRAQIDQLKVSNPVSHRACMGDLVTIANDAAHSIEVGDAVGFVDAHRRAARALDRLGRAAHVGIVPDHFEELEEIARLEGASFCVSGAGGGDVAARIGLGPPSSDFLVRAHQLGLFVLDVALDQRGVRVDDSPPSNTLSA